jgi:anti-sigma regulatory factor (Ser/Thr protein kinase)
MSAPAMLSLLPPNRIEALVHSLDAIEAFLQSWRVDDGDRAQVMIIVDEIASNIIKGAWPDGGDHEFRIELNVMPEPGFLHLEILAIDDGIAFDPTDVPPPDLDSDLEDREPGGLGLFMVTEMSDSVGYQRNGEHNRLTVTKRLQREAEIQE